MIPRFNPSHPSDVLSSAIDVSARPGGGSGEVGEGTPTPPLYKHLLQRQAVRERRDHGPRGEVEDQAERDGDGQRRQGSLDDGQQQQRQAQTLPEQRATGMRSDRVRPTKQTGRV